MSIGAEMPRYVSHKEVSALQIDYVEGGANDAPAVIHFVDSATYAPVSVDGELNLFVRYFPKHGDYYVVYRGGYASILPQKEFEDGYTRLNPVYQNTAIQQKAGTPREISDHIVNPANDRIKIAVTDELGAGGANHRYEISGFDLAGNPAAGYPAVDDRYGLDVVFQQGPIPEAGVNGVTQEVLLAIVADRLR